MSIEIDKTILQKELNELVAELDIHKQLIRLFGKRPHAHQKPDLDIGEALDCIRIGVKYLFLENEALNRVNNMLREMWDNSRNEIEKEDDITDSYNKKEKSSLCPYCGQPLRTPLAKQCFECHVDWHDPNNVIKHDVDDTKSTDKTKMGDELDINDDEIRRALGIDD